MKTLAKVLIILGMVIGGIAVIPLVVGILALVKLNKAKSKKEIIIPAILVLVFGNILAGIVMLLISEKSFENGKKEVVQDNSSVQTTVTSSSSSFSKVLIPLISVVAVIGIALLGVGGFGIYKLAFEKQEVSFNTNGGSIVETVKVKKNDKVLKPQDPVKEGHTFLGWYYQGQEWSFIGYSITEDITLEAKWQINQYTITFDTDGGTQIPSITQDYGTAVEKPQDPVKEPEKYVFSHWELDGEEYEFDTIPSKNITLIAKYKKIKYSVTFNTNGGNDIEPIIIYYGTDTKVDNPIKEGHTFIGWYYNNEEWSFKNYQGEDDVVIDAKWQINQYTITFDTDGGTKVQQIIQDYETSVKSPEEPTKEGYTFSGWYYKNKEFNFEEFKLTHDLNLIAKWQINQYSIIFDTDGGTEVPSVVLDYGETIDLSSVVSYKNYCEFNGFDIEAPAVMPAHNIVLKVVWMDYSQDFEFSKNSIVKCISKKEELTIPSSYYYDGIKYDITTIEKDSFYNNTNLTKVMIPNSVTYIGESTFAYCANLTSIIIPDSVTSIGDSAFYSCDSLTSITIPNSIQNIKSRTFAYCYNLTNIYIPDSVQYIGEYAFSNCTSLTSVTILGNVQYIGEYAFSYCNNLIIYCGVSSKPSSWDSNWDYSVQAVYWNIEERIITVNDFEYYIIDSENNKVEIIKYSGSESSIIVSGSINYNNKNYEIVQINKNAFEKCSNLVDIKIEKEIVSIESAVFSGCTSLENVYYNGTIEDWCNIKFGNYLSNPMSNAEHFYMLDENNEYYEVTEIEIPNTITSIGNYQFYGFDNITSVTIGNSVTSIEYEAFFNCTSLTSVTIGNSVTSIEYEAFSNCTSLTNITIPESVTSIEKYAFGNCSSLVEVVFTKNSKLTYIDSSIFSNCSELTNIYFSKNIINVHESAFGNCKKITNIYYDGNIENWCNINFGSCITESGINFYMLDENNEYQEVVEIIIPGTVTIIKPKTFYGFKNVKKIIIKDGVKEIGSKAFGGCKNLTNIIIPDTIESISSEVFVSCTSLESISIPAINRRIRSLYTTMTAKTLPLKEVIITSGNNICDAMFSGCENLTSVTIPNSITSIGDSAFSNCTSLTNITIPDSVTSIGDGAFKYCTSLIDINVSVNNNNYQSINGSLYSKDGKTLIRYCCKKEIVLFEVPNFVEKIESYAFSNSNNLTSIVIPNSVTYIGESAFFGCTGLTSIIIPESVTSIKENAFFGCEILKIYCEATSQPSGWEKTWNRKNIDDDNYYVVWGYKGE